MADEAQGQQSLKVPEISIADIACQQLNHNLKIATLGEQVIMQHVIVY